MGAEAGADIKGNPLALSIGFIPIDHLFIIFTKINGPAISSGFPLPLEEPEWLLNKRLFR